MGGIRALQAIRHCLLAMLFTFAWASPAHLQLFNLIVIYEYPHEQASLRSPVVDRFKLSSPPLDLCVQFSGDADFEDFEEGDPL